ncbi:hypothetical protein LTR53_014539 [Teratosphaeriaceae sp. CCFEE 6253]|nr:hypothetical protein LTR53_014539 [Teratosphaeriaceae sp. CCFEE 6253]
MASPELRRPRDTGRHFSGSELHIHPLGSSRRGTALLLPFLVRRLAFRLDDTMIALALFFTIVLTAIILLGEYRYDWNKHSWDVQPVHITGARIVGIVGRLAFSLAATFTRLSLCAFYYRIVKDSGINWFKWVVHGTVAFTVAVGIGPVEYYWQYPSDGSGHCANEGATTLALGMVNIFNDLLTALVPIPLVMRLNMPLGQRVGVCVLFGLGITVIGAGIVRTYYIWKGFLSSWDSRGT